MSAIQHTFISRVDEFMLFLFMLLIIIILTKITFNLSGVKLFICTI